MTLGQRVLLGAVLTAFDVACIRLNPAFFLDDDDTAEVGGDSEAGTVDVPGDTTADPVETTSGGSGGDGSDTGLETTGGAIGSTTEDLPGTTALATSLETTLETTDGTSTGAPALQVLEVQADAAACVLVPILIFPIFGGPTDCESRVEQATAFTGGVLVDTAFIDGGNGRPGRIYLRFSIPAELADATVVDAQLELHVADFAGAGSNAAGVLATTAPFLPEDLAQSAPGAVAGLEQPIGPTSPGETVLGALPLELLVPGEAVHLGIFPTSDDGAVFAGNGADAGVRPKLTITYY